MRQQILFFFIFFATLVAHGQHGTDYVILRPGDKLSKPDTIFGDIVFPQNGVLINATIQTTNGRKKYSPNKVIGFKYGNRYFASVPYTTGHVFAERLINGKIELCYYTTEIQNTAYPGGLSGDVMAYIGISLTSYYYIKSNKTQEYISVPHSKKKLVKNIAFIFEDNEKVLKQIQSKEFEIDQLPELIRKYNISNN